MLRAGLLVPLLSLALAALAEPAPALADDDLRRIPSPGSDLDAEHGALLAPILVPRVPGSSGSARVQRHFVDFFRANLPEWELVWQNSTYNTPTTNNTDMPFANLAFRRDPPGVEAGSFSRLTLVAHYDSKLKPWGFIGATDSAAPCAMLLHVARSIEGPLKAKWAKDGVLAQGQQRAPTGLQILLLDGEEAFEKWTATDSLYGARSLATQWESESNGALSKYRSTLDSISLFVLLDLLGSPNPKVPSYFKLTHWAYRTMASVEGRMRGLGLLETKQQDAFLPDGELASSVVSTRRGIEDDHIPFMFRGVDILHIIPSPFPLVWHTQDDDGPHLHPETVRDWARIVTGFTAELMELGGYLSNKAPGRESKPS
ncbi:hypothetical protein CDD83_5234 [Cordyceps sp. RAO-2017]|nr:hypothetical protein CDD83_5234 [Cordyceps sp. RAO-2017]